MSTPRRVYRAHRCPAISNCYWQTACIVLAAGRFETFQINSRPMAFALSATDTMMSLSTSRAANAVKLAADATMLSQALGLAALREKKTPTLAHLIAADGAVSISSCDGNTATRTSVAATIFEPGEIAVAADRLGALAGAFRPGAKVLLTATERALIIVSENGRYRLPLAEAPAALAITLLTLFEPLSAAGSEATRLYLCGIFLHSLADRLYAVATDGVTLMRTSVAADNLTTGTIIPTGAVTIMARLIRRTRPATVSLRRSDTLFEVIAPAFTFTTRLIGVIFPDYRRVLFAAANVAACARSDLSSALARLSASAVAAAGAATPLVALTWTGGKPLQIFLPRQPDDGADVLPAETQGDARIALSLPALVALVAEFDNESLRLEVAEGRALVIRTNSKLGMLSSCRWNFGEAAALTD